MGFPEDMEYAPRTFPLVVQMDEWRGMLNRMRVWVLYTVLTTVLLLGYLGHIKHSNPEMPQAELTTARALVFTMGVTLFLMIGDVLSRTVFAKYTQTKMHDAERDQYEIPNGIFPYLPKVGRVLYVVVIASMLALWGYFCFAGLVLNVY